MADGVGAGASDGIPAIRTFQLDSTSVGQLAAAVNLFRGDVNIPQDLFSLPGRQAGDGMDVTLTLMYQSNVFRSATTWNRDSPTGVLGLGWDLPLTYIAAASSGSPDPQTRTYVYYDNGTPNALIQQPQLHALFAIPATVANSLTSGQPITAQLRSSFLDNGLPVDPAAIAIGAGDAWVITDDALQQQFSIQPSATDATCIASYAGQAYQLQSYRFWQIVYFPAYERWLVVTDDGLRRSFGGTGPTTAQGYRTAIANSIAWSVWWGADGALVWAGPSGATADQQQVACGWYLESTTNIWGDRVSYQYNGFDRGSSGLLPDVEQQVGAGGLPYTKQMYLTQVTDVFGRTATPLYGDKVYGDEGPREYADPHRATPSNAPNAYQDRYDTKYLMGVDVAAVDGSPLLGVDFEYLPSPSASGPEQALANVTATAGAASYDLYKRYLTAARITNARGSALPGYRYEYNLSSDASQPGALASITSPQGGGVYYSYTQNELSVCDRTQAVQRPTQTPNGVPSVFYGDDYAVSLWCDPITSYLTLQVFTWCGRWITWQLEATSPVLYDGPIQESTLDVLANANFFVVSFSTGSKSLAWAFSKDTARPGQFVAATVAGIASAVNQPTLSYSGTVSYVGGDAFFAIAAMSPNSESYSYDVLTWAWTTGSWERQSQTPAQYTWLAAQGEYLLALDSSGGVSFAFLDGTLRWTTAEGSTIKDFQVPGNDYANICLAADTATVVVNLLTAQNTENHSYQLYILQWDADHALQPVTTPEIVSEPQPYGYQLPWQPVIVNNSLVAVNGTLLRFDGAEWIVNTAFVGAERPPAPPRFAYGPDYALMATSANSQGLVNAFEVLGYDPDASGWAAKPATYQLSAATHPYDNWPTAGNADYAVVGSQLYFRGTATDWTTVPGNAATSFTLSAGSGEAFESQSLVNEGPGFLAFSSPAAGDDVSPLAEAIVLNNGQPGATFEVAQQRMYTPSVEASTPTPGSAPQGPSMFVGYCAAASTFRTASMIYLNRYAGDALGGPVVHWPVTSVTVDDGYQEPAVTTYAPDPSTSACDPTGLVVKYYSTTVYPGSPQASPVSGTSVTTYLNGQSVDAADYYEMLDGLLSSTQLYDNDGTCVEAHASSWSVVQQVASDPTDPAAPPTALHGGWVQLDEQSSTVDGVTSATTNAFTVPGLPGPFSGRPVTVTRTSFDAGGTERSFVRSMTSAPQASAAMRALNLRSRVVQTTTQVQAGDGVVVVSASASAPTAWPSGAGDGIQVPALEGQFWLTGGADPAFPFASYAAGQTPDGWALDRRITAKTVAGQTAEWVDASGTATSSIYSGDLAFPVAEVSNSPLGESAYLAFEPYEDTSAWQFTNTALQTGDVRTGATALLLAGGAGASLSVALPAVSDTRVLGIWYKASGAGPECSIAASGPAQTTTVAASNGNWALATIGIPLDAGVPISLTVTVSNPSNIDILLDSVWVVPLVGGVIGRTFDATSRLVTSAADAAGRTRWTLYDAFDRPALQLGPDRQPKELAVHFLSRQGSATDVFEPACPNAELTLHPAGGGSVQTFTDLDGWQTTWQPADPKAWDVSQAGLVHVGSSDDALTYVGSLPPTWAVAFEVAVGEKPPSLRLAAGDVTVAYGPDGYAGWQGSAPLADPPLIASRWLLVAGDGVVLFFGDGQLLFSAAAGAELGSPVITVGSDLTLSQLAFMSGPRLSVSYNDGGGRLRQAHRLSGADGRVCEVLYDALGRIVATTRVAPGSFGSGAALPVLAYRPGFVDADAFLSALTDTWVMTGDIADYYRGQTFDGIQRSDDGGFPYRGTRWEASPRNRKLELGQPGHQYAIRDVASTMPADRATTQLAYGANDGQSPPVPAGEYSQTTVTTPVKTTGMRLNDKFDQSVFSTAATGGGQPVARSAVLRTYGQTSAGPQTSIDMQLPNALVEGPQTGDDSYVVTTVVDAISRTLSRSAVDSGETQFVYDPCGRVRFVLAAQADGESPSLGYTRYDAIGRVVEQGTVAMDWDVDTLTGLAAQRDWPTADVPRTVSATLSYDGDGNDATTIGKKAACTTITPPPEGGVATVVDELFAYDASGRVTGSTVTVGGPTSCSAATAYGYNGLGEVVLLTYPQGSPISSVRYALDDQGRITAVGTENSVSDIAEFSYTADGAIDTETLDGGAWVRTVAYASPGWPLVVATTAEDGQSLTLAYTYNADGAVATRSVDYAFPSADETLVDAYTYDAQGQLTAADGSSDDQVTSYDPNGNLLAATVGGDQQTFSQAAGTDQLQQATVGGSTTEVVYDARGRVTSALGRTLSYDDSTNLTVAASMGADQVQYGYGSRRQRVLKQVTGANASSTVYVCGPGGSPIARLDGANWTALVHGPSGLVATCSQEVLYPLKDPQRTAWAVVAASGLAARTVLLPFGSPVTGTGAFPYTFMGQEWDAELAVYDFGDRLYDPVLRRFLAPDPALQFPSPYVFCANDPLNVSDPTGDLALWGRILIGVGMGALIIAGIAATIATAGAAAPAVAAGEVALGAAEVGAVGTGVAAAEGAAEGGAAAGAAVAEGGAAASGGAAAAEGGGAAAGEVAAGASSSAAAGGTGAAASTSATVLANLGNMGLQSGLGIVQGVGLSGLQYDIQNGRTFTAAGFLEAAGWGALSGAIGGALGGIPGMPFLEAGMNSLSKVAQFAINVGAQTVGGVAASEVTNVLTNVAATGPDRPPWYGGMLKTLWLSAAESAGSAAFTSGVSLGSPTLKTIGEQTIGGAGSALDHLQTLARSDAGTASMVAAGFFSTAGAVATGSWFYTRRGSG